MDEKGYAFTPLVFLLFIPIMIIAVDFDDVVHEANSIVAIAMGGDVTYSTVTNIISATEKGGQDAGRSAAYNATRVVIDKSSNLSNPNPFFASGQSKKYIIDNTLPVLNANVIATCLDMEKQTGREIYINNIKITNYTNATFSASDITITQTEPFGFYINLRGGIPIKVVQKDQVYEGTLPSISSYVSIRGMEDPYIWVNSKQRTSNIIYEYPYYKDYENSYFFDENVSVDDHRLNFLWECLNGTDNPSQITPRPYYFPDPLGGLTFFDRLENRSTSSDSNNKTWMSTFILGDPLKDEHAGNEIVSRLDHEYFSGVTTNVGPIYIGTGNDKEPMQDSSGTAVFYLSKKYKDFFGLDDWYNN
ncbi:MULTISPECIES: hypothetical protein [Methanobacterium]|uniref:Uncharacterized protein n=1 Tax=Methanobacterium bryantii TaxID=2161 RepID=A0A2A2H8D2_METBR|nr:MULTISPECIES: hypothetical protein [Methanobacterium]OEC84878.1 hypothetical protein A9507_14555 [Methanobacterium sp. A39]PAV05530.1 hypothetical protein ASJ80_09140 [Methanobacterium bryantii]